MISKDVKKGVENGSAIRALFEEGKNLADKYGAENVCDFSLGNPNIAPPDAFRKSIVDILENEDPVYVNGYMNNAGYPEVRSAVAENLNKRFDTSFNANNIIMCVGAASGLNVILKTLMNPGDEVITFAPYFLEYRNYVNNYNGKLVEVPANPPTFMPDIEAFEKLITPTTKAVIINNPNNPTGVVYDASVITAIAEVLNKKEKEFGTSIYLISDEPYRELVYDKETVVPYITKFYHNAIIGYSFSKSLSLPGERIGYLVIPSEADDYQDVFDGAVLCHRILGFVNAPSLIQLAVARCLDETADIDFYGKNRKLLYDALTEMGFECVKPEGAFYLWVKTPIDETEFVNLCKKHLILVVAGSGFAGPGYVRLAYCISTDVIEKAIPKFKAIMEEINNMK